MKKQLLFILFFSFLFFSCGLNNTSISFSLSDNAINTICREAGTSEDNLSVKCVLKQEGYADIVKTSEVKDNKALIEFSEIPVNSVIKISATVDFNKALNNKFIEKYEGTSELYTVIEGENRIPIILSPVYKEGSTNISISDGKNTIILNVFYKDLEGKEIKIDENDIIKISEFSEIIIKAEKVSQNEDAALIFFLNGKKQEVNDNVLTISKEHNALSNSNLILIKLVNKDNIEIANKDFSFNISD